MASEKMLVGRHKRVAFMDADGSGKTFTRMTGFTSLSDGKNSTEYSRQYYEHKTKARWFETMKASHKDAIREGAEKLAGQ